MADYEALFEEKFELLLQINREEVVNWEGAFRPALRDLYPHINEGMKKTNGQGFPKQHFAQGVDPHNVMNIGSEILPAIRKHTASAAV